MKLSHATDFYLNGTDLITIFAQSLKNASALK